MSWTCMQSFSFIPLTVSEKIFEYFSKIYPLYCHGNQLNSAIWTKFIWIVGDYSRNISVKKNLNICSETAKIANSHFSHFKSMETLSCHSNQSSYPIRTKNTIIRSLICRCYMWNIETIGFWGDVVWKSWQADDRRATDALPIPFHQWAFSSGELKIVCCTRTYPLLTFLAFLENKTFWLHFHQKISFFSLSSSEKDFFFLSYLPNQNI